MRVQSKSTESELQLPHAVAVKTTGQSFSELLAQSSKTAQSDASEIAQQCAVASEEQREANTSHQRSAHVQTSKQTSPAKSSCNVKAMTQSARKENAQRDQTAKTVVKDDTGEDQSPIRLAAERDETRETPDQAQPNAQQNELTAVPAQPNANEPTADAPTAAADVDSVVAVSTQGSMQACTGQSDAMQSATDAQQALKGAFVQPDEASNREVADAQQAEAKALLEELGVGDLERTTDLAAQQQIDSQAPASSQPRACSAGGNQQFSTAKVSTANSQTSAGQTAGFDLTNLQASASGAPVVSAVAAAGGNSDATHTNSAANGSSDPAGHRTETDTTPLGAGILHTDLVNALQTATVPQHIESQQVGAVHSTLTDSEIGAQTATAAGEPMTDQNNGSKLAGMSGISTAQLIHTLRDSEMRVGIHLNEFGSVSIRTTVTEQQMQTQIAVDHSELGSALAAHIPSMQQKLGRDFGLQSSIEVNANGSGFTGSRQHTSQQQTAAPAMVRTQPQGLTPEISRVQIPVAADSAYRLDIRA